MHNSQKSSLIFDIAFDDNITSINYHQPSNNKNLLLTTCMDKTIRIIEYNVTVNNSLDDAEFTSYQLIKCSALTEPLVCSNLDRYNNLLIVGTNDGKIYSYDMNLNRTTQIGLHSEYIKNIFRLKDEDNSPLFSISHDGELKFWDLRMNRSIFSYDFKEKYLCGSYQFPIFLAGVNEKEIRCFNMNYLGYQEFGPCNSFTSPLGEKSVNIAIFPKLDGYIVNSDEGRCAVNHIKLNESQNITDFIASSNTSLDFIFRCHIQTVLNTKKIYRINSIKFNNLYNTFATCGADGKLIIWDNIHKCKLSEISFIGSPNITEMQYSDCGNFLAYSSGNEENSTINKVQLGINYLKKKEKKGEKFV